MSKQVAEEDPAFGWASGFKKAYRRVNCQSLVSRGVCVGSHGVCPSCSHDSDSTIMDTTSHVYRLAYCDPAPAGVIAMFTRRRKTRRIYFTSVESN